jgi:amidase
MSTELTRRSLLQAAAASPLVGFAQRAFAEQKPIDAPPASDNLATIDGLGKLLRTSSFSAKDLTNSCLKQIEALDRNGPKLNSVIEVNPDALAIAETLAQEHKENGPRGPLHGVPVLIKDNIDTADKMQTTAGSLVLVGAKPPKDSAVARRLREAGAVILGKTNLSEWANIRASVSTSGWSGRGGLTRNPYALDRNTSGSSSGTAAAIAAGLAVVGVGTETDGSIVSPSSTCGLVGIKPTVGLIGRSGIIPISESQDTAGPMARSVRDAAILLGVLAGPDPDDKATESAKGHVEADYTKFLDAKGLKGSRIGVCRRLPGFGEATLAIYEESLQVLKKEGATLIDEVDPKGFTEFDDDEMIVLLYELKAGLNAYLARLKDSPVKSLADVIAFNEKNKDKELRYFGQDNLVKAQVCGPLTDKKYKDAREKCLRLTRAEGIDAIMDKHKLDALVAPTSGPAWVTDLVNGDHFAGGSSSPAAVAGYPAITLPMGHLFGLPVGLTFYGRAWSEPTLLKLAYSFEQTTKAYKPPRFLLTVDFKG